MDITKKINLKYITFILFILLIFIFPLGQLLRIEKVFVFGKVDIQPIDIVVFLSSLFSIIFNFKKPKLFKSINTFLLYCLFSLLISLSLFSFKEVFIGLLYLIRLGAYLYFIIFIFNLVIDKSNIYKVFDLLIIASLFVAIFGWLQYILYPDLRDLRFLGWDDHLYRLVGTFLDPGFTGEILVLGSLSVLTKYFNEKKKYILFLAIFLSISIAFTYSRAAYLSFLIGFSALIFILKNKLKSILIMIIMLIGIIFLLPRPSSEGVNLERLYSIYAKVSNYEETFSIIKINPLFGIGFNNICTARIKFLNTDNINSHSCYGSDSSLLLLFATTGITGLILFIKLIFDIIKSLDASIYSKVFLASSFAVLVDSLFINSLFYPWILLWLVILLGLSVKKENNQGL
jgi:hypothetical protein